MSLLTLLGQGKLVSALRAFSHSALNSRLTARTSKGSAISYIKSKATLRALHYMFRFRNHQSFSLNHSLNEVLKTFLEMFKRFDAKFLTTLKTIRCNIQARIKYAHKERLGMEC